MTKELKRHNRHGIPFARLSLKDMIMLYRVWNTPRFPKGVFFDRHC